MSEAISLLANLGSIIATDETSIATLQTDVASIKVQIGSLVSVLATDTGAITAMGSQLAAMGVQLANRGTVTTPGTISAGGSTVAPAPATIAALGTMMPWGMAALSNSQAPKTQMPADPGIAPIPSPDGMMISTSIAATGTVYYTATDATGVPIAYPSGVLPYARDLMGAIYRITPQYNTNAYGKNELNGRINNYDWHGCDALFVCQGTVWVRDGGQYFYEKQTTGTGGDVSYANLPAAWVNGGTPFTTTPAAIDNSAGTVTTPSPEYATSLFLVDPTTGVGEVSGAPYLIDNTGTRYAFGSSGELIINGSTSSAKEVLMTVRQGAVWCLAPEGQMQTTAGANELWPAAFVPGTDQPPMPALPPPSPIVGGSSGTTLTAGPGMQYPTINQAVTAAAAGDAVIVAPGTYAETLRLTAPILLTGAPFLVLDNSGCPTMEADGITPAGASTPHVIIAAPNDGYQGKGAIVLDCDGCVVQDLEVSGAGLDQTGPDMCCGIRGDAPGNHLVRRVWSHANQMGVGSDALVLAITVESSVLSDNGIPGTGCTHNAYCDGVQAIFRNCISVKPRDAHCLKLRANHAEVIDCITSGATNAANIDMPNGSGQQNIIQGGTHSKAAGSPNYCVISYGAEGATFGTAGVAINGTTIQNDCSGGFIQAMGGNVTIDATSTITGTAPLLAWSGNTGTVIAGGAVVAAGGAIG